MSASERAERMVRRATCTAFADRVTSRPSNLCGPPQLPHREFLLSAADCCELSEGELHYVWWFIQGSIMDADVRWRLRRAWGMCPRHAWGALAAEAAFRGNYFHGPAVLYHDLIQRALRVGDLRGPLAARRIARRLRSSGPCLMCEMGLDRSSRGACSRERVDQGRDLRSIREFARRTEEYWRPTVCGRCLGDGSRTRCRPHLVGQTRDGRLEDVPWHLARVAEILDGLTAFAQSYRWEYRGTETRRDQAALLSAVGWCSGWQVGLAWLG